MCRLFEVALAPHTTSSLRPLDFESGQVLSQMPYEYSSFFDLPPSALGKRIEITMLFDVHVFFMGYLT